MIAGRPMPRRALIAGAVAAAAMPGRGVARAVTPYRVVYLTDGLLGPPVPALFEAFRDGLRDGGYVDGRHVVIERRHAATPDHRKTIAGELVLMKPAVVVTDATAVFEFRDALRPFPVVFAAFSDPVGAGFATSLARPGGNMTGLSYLGFELNPKRLAMLKETFPRLTRVGALAGPHRPTRERQGREIRTAADSLGIDLVIVDVEQRNPTEIAPRIQAAFDALVRARVQAVMNLQGPGFVRERRTIADLALRHRLPGIFDLTLFAEAGGLMSYAPSLSDLWRQAAGYVTRILEGAKPGDLPIEQPRTFEFVINMKTARRLGVTISPPILLRADRIIE